MVYHKKEIQIPRDFKPRVKWVKNANMWVKVFVKDGKMVQEWYSEKPVLEDGSLVKQEIT